MLQYFYLSIWAGTILYSSLYSLQIVTRGSTIHLKDYSTWFSMHVCSILSPFQGKKEKKKICIIHRARHQKLWYDGLLLVSPSFSIRKLAVLLCLFRNKFLLNNFPLIHHDPFDWLRSFPMLLAATYAMRKIFVRSPFPDQLHWHSISLWYISIFLDPGD